MAEIGALASIIGVVGAGAKLSIMLFEFGSAIGSAGTEVRAIGTEISLFCAVLKQLYSTLTKAKSFRYSVSVIDTTQTILEKCQQIFREIEAILDGLRRGKAGASEAHVDFVARVKWTFKRSQVQMLRTTLESCKLTLHIMLTTMDFAQKMATRRISTIETDHEDEQDKVVTQSLIIAQQCVIDTLETLEEEQDEVPPLGQSSSNVTTASKAQNRNSVWLNGLIFEKSMSTINRRLTWEGVSPALYTARTPNLLLQKWTDQGGNIARGNNNETENIVEVPKGVVKIFSSQIGYDEEKKSRPSGTITEWTAEDVADFLTSIGLEQYGGRFIDEEITGEALVAIVHDELKEMEVSSLGHRLMILQKVYDLKKEQNVPIYPGDYVPPEEANRSEISKQVIRKVEKVDTGTDDPNPKNIAMPDPVGNMCKSFQCDLHDSTRKVLPAALKKYKIDAPWENYMLYIVYGTKERCLGLDEEPMVIFKSLSAEGEKPMFILRKKAQHIAETSQSSQKLNESLEVPRDMPSRARSRTPSPSGRPVSPRSPTSSRQSNLESVNIQKKHLM